MPHHGESRDVPLEHAEERLTGIRRSDRMEEVVFGLLGDARRAQLASFRREDVGTGRRAHAVDEALGKGLEGSAQMRTHRGNGIKK